MSQAVLRGIDPTPLGVPTREIQARAGISTEAARWATGVLEPNWVSLVPDPGRPRGKAVRLTRAGARLQTDYRDRVAAVEREWQTRFGATVHDLRSALEDVTGREAGALLRSGMPAPEGCWRAATSPPTELPHFPMVLHCGAYPDGA